jgi:acetoin utilization deacetylase AcuC-like enzyme
MNRVGFLYDDIFLEHETPFGHPENKERLRAILKALRESGLWDRLVHIKPRKATEDELAMVHARSHIEKMKNGRGYADPDTYISERSFEAALYAAGAVLEAIERCKRGEIRYAFCAVRPPGHHAEANRAMGFCLFNNVAVAAMYALRRHGLQRVLIVDWDVHHGNGTMHSFYETDEVLYFSVHQYPHYPGTGRTDEIGRGAGQGYTVNVPLYGGQGDSEYLYVFRQLLVPVARQYAPQLILVSAGFDTHRNDPLADMRLSSRAYGWMASILQELSDECCPGRLAFTLEGGYEHAALGEGVAAVLSGLIRGRDNNREDEPENPEPGNVEAQTRQVSEELRRLLRPNWKNI